MRLSVLDQSTVASGRTPGDAIQETLALARHCEALGYERYWLAEHHNSLSVAGSAPEVLIAAIAATTRRIRVGSAGVMLPHYAPLKVAEQFRVLEAIAPGRIDLGLGRAPGGDGRTAHALNPNAAEAADHFPADVRDVLAWLSGERLVEGHPFRDVRAQPEGASVPEVWILGSSAYGAQVAAHFGLPYCFAHFFTDGAGAAEAIGLYRARFRPTLHRPVPHAAIAVWALAADTEAEAAYHLAPRLEWRFGLSRGVYTPLASPEEAAAIPHSDGERAWLDALRDGMIWGTGAAVFNKLQRLAETLGVAEMAIITTVHDTAARRHSYALIAEAAALCPQVTLAAE